MEIVIKGLGEAVICFIDSAGKTLLQESLRSAGSDALTARRPVDLVVDTRNGRVELSPVLVSCGGKQRVTFDGDNPAEVTRRRCHEIGCADALAEEAGRGHATLLRQDPTRPLDHYRART